MIPQFDIDWQQYFKDFSAAHGGEPVAHEGRLLFRDGWQYSIEGGDAEFHQEFPPPQEVAEQARLQRFYWKRRLWIVKQDLDELERQINFLDTAIAAHEVPLTTVNTVIVIQDDGSIKTEKIVMLGEQRLNQLKARRDQVMREYTRTQKTLGEFTTDKVVETDDVDSGDDEDGWEEDTDPDE